MAGGVFTTLGLAEKAHTGSSQPGRPLQQVGRGVPKATSLRSPWQRERCPARASLIV